MTASRRFAYLDAEGEYFDGRRAGSRMLIVKFGNASLTLIGPNEEPIAHWPLASLRRLPGSPAGPEELRLVPDHDGDERLVLRDRDMIAALREVCPDLEARPKALPVRKRRVALWSATAVAAVLLMVFVIAPDIAEKLANAIPPANEIALGEAAAKRVISLFGHIGKRDNPVCASSEGDAALAKLAARLTATIDVHVPIRLQVIDTPMVNAIALPGGQILILRGLIDKASGPEEVAGVLAHEIGHVIHRDPTREAIRAAGSAGVIGLLLGDFVGGGVATVVSEHLINSSYTREAERAADDAAIDIMTRAKLPTAPLAKFFARLRVEHREPARLSEFLASHPSSDARERKMRAADTIGQAPFEPALNDQEWQALRAICG